MPDLAEKRFGEITAVDCQARWQTPFSGSPGDRATVSHQGEELVGW